MQITYQTPTLYKRDSNRNIRVWHAEVGTDGTSYFHRTVSGVIDGKKVESGWKSVEQKNIGKSNETSLEQQAIFEVTSNWERRQEHDFFVNRSDVDQKSTKVSPMLASKHEDTTYDFIRKSYYSQPKLDGIRCVAKSDGLYTRQGKLIVSVPHISDELQEFFTNNPDAILDGELYNHDLRDDFNKITSLVRKTKPNETHIAESAELVQYHVYDVISSDEIFSNRMEFLFDNFSDFKSVIPVETNSISNHDEMDTLYGSYLENGFEGQMIRENDIYERKRSKFLIKRKEFLDAEFDVVSMEEGRGNWAGYVKRFILKLDDNRNFGAGVRGNQELLRDLWVNQTTPNWVTLRYFTPTPDGVPRFPVVVDWGFGTRED